MAAMTAADLRDLLEQVEAGRADLLRVAVELAHRLRVADPKAAKEVTQGIQGQRAGLAQSRKLEAGITADVLGLVVDAPRGVESGAGG